MLRVTVELVPHGNEKAKRTLREFTITNIETTDNIAKYLVQDPQGSVLGYIEQWDRDLPVTMLVRQALYHIEESDKY